MYNFTVKTFFNNIFGNNKQISRKAMFKYGIPSELNFKTEVKKDGYIVLTSPDLPGFIAQAKSANELPKVISEAVLCYFEVPNEEGNMLPGVVKYKELEFITGKQQVLQAA